MRLRIFLGMFAFLLSVVSCQLLVVRPAHAQTVQTNNYYLNTNPDVPQNFHTYTQSVLIELASAASCQISGIDPTNPNGKCLGIDPKTGRIGFVEGGGGLIGLTGNMIAVTFQIPVSSTHYGKYLADNFGIAKNAYAQDSGGLGFNGLKPLLAVWQIFRNIVYLFFVLIFVIIGVAIMFRIKIDPRTVMTIQNQIPKIIIALILVTFSYAIAGFLIDMMYVFMYLIFNLLSPVVGGGGSGAVSIGLGSSTKIIGNGTLNPVYLQGSNPLSAIGFLGGVKIAGAAALGIGSIISSLFDGSIGRIISTVLGTLLGAAAGGLGPLSLITAPLGFAAGAIFGGKFFGAIGTVIAFVVIAAALLTALFRLWFQLIKAYISILINITLAPFWIAGGLIPGSPVNFSAWIRDMVGNLASFPATLVMLLFGKIFINAFGKNSSPNNFVPPFVGNPGDSSAFGAIIGLGIILLTPNVVNLVRQAIKAPSGKVMAGIGQSVGIGAQIAGAPVQGIGKQLWGTDPYTKEARPLTRAVTKRLSGLGTKLGRFGKPFALASKGISMMAGGALTPEEKFEQKQKDEQANIAYSKNVNLKARRDSISSNKFGGKIYDKLSSSQKKIVDDEYAKQAEAEGEARAEGEHATPSATYQSTNPAGRPPTEEEQRITEDAKNQSDPDLKAEIERLRNAITELSNRLGETRTQERDNIENRFRIFNSEYAEREGRRRAAGKPPDEEKTTS